MQRLSSAYACFHPKLCSSYIFDPFGFCKFDPLVFGRTPLCMTSPVYFHHTVGGHSFCFPRFCFASSFLHHRIYRCGKWYASFIFIQSFSKLFDKPLLLLVLVHAFFLFLIVVFVSFVFDSCSFIFNTDKSLCLLHTVLYHRSSFMFKQQRIHCIATHIVIRWKW